MNDIWSVRCLFLKLVLALVLVLAVLLTGCTGTVPSVTVEPTEVIPTEVPPTAVPSPTPTAEPTATPTEVPTPTATFEPGVWGIAQQMLAEVSDPAEILSVVDLGDGSMEIVAVDPPLWWLTPCFPGDAALAAGWYLGEWRVRSSPPNLDEHPSYGPTCSGSSYPTPGEIYGLEMGTQIMERHPELAETNSQGQSAWVDFTADMVLRNSGQFHNPFSEADLSWNNPAYQRNWEDFELVMCPLYILFYEWPPEENSDGDGIMVGEALLFYEVGGTDPLRFDGELREVRFVFPPVP